MSDHPASVPLDHPYTGAEGLSLLGCYQPMIADGGLSLWDVGLLCWALHWSGKNSLGDSLQSKTFFTQPFFLPALLS